MTNRLLRSDRWTWSHVAAAVAMAVVSALRLRGPAWVDIYHIATADEEADHVLLVPLVALWMLWARRVRFRYCKPAFTMLGPIIVAIGWLIGSYGFHNGVVTFVHGGAVLVVLGCIVSVLGKHAIFRFLPVVAVLVFLIPRARRGPPSAGDSVAKLDCSHRTTDVPCAECGSCPVR